MLIVFIVALIYFRQELLLCFGLKGVGVLAWQFHRRLCDHKPRLASGYDWLDDYRTHTLHPDCQGSVQPIALTLNHLP